jgi:hypothetical protein
MMSTRSLKGGLLCVFAVVAVFAANASAGEYNLKARPEIGRCLSVPSGGEFRGKRCTLSEPGKGKSSWHSGPGAKQKFSGPVREGFKIVPVGFANGEINCITNGEIEGEYTGPKNLTIKKLLLKGCHSGAGPCQTKAGSPEGEITFEELAGELGFISHPRPLKIGWDLHPKSGANLASFECGGEIVAGKSTGTGTSRELQGSVIGVAGSLDRMGTVFTLVDEIKHGAQFPQRFEHGVVDTLTMQVGEKLPGTGKTPFATLLRASSQLKGEEALEVLAKCAGSGC